MARFTTMLSPKCGLSRRPITGRPSRFVVAAHRQGDEDVTDLVLVDQHGQVAEGAEDVQIVGPAAALLLDEADRLDTHPVGVAKSAGRLARHPPGADNDGVVLVVALLAQGAQGGPTGTAGAQHPGHRHAREQQHRHPRLVRVAEVEGRRHGEQRQKGSALEDADHFFPEAAHAVDVVKPGQPIGHGRQDDNQRQVPPAKSDVRNVAADRHPAGVEANVVRSYPGDRRQKQIPGEKPGVKDLTAAFNHGGPRPWEEWCLCLVFGVWYFVFGVPCSQVGK
jgi:hypothetical protein